MSQVFGVSTDPKPGVDGHIFPNPVDPNSYMCMLCYKNGSLTRQGKETLSRSFSCSHIVILTHRIPISVVQILGLAK